MYRVSIRQGFNGERETIHSEYVNGIKLLAGSISKEVGKIDRFTFKINPASDQYGNFHHKTTFVDVIDTRLNKTLFDGRVLDQTDEMSNEGDVVKEITCESLMAFLHDSVQDFYELTNNELTKFFTRMIDNHNSQVETYKQFKVGNITVKSPSDNVYKAVDETKTTFDNIQDKLVAKYGGELQVRNENGILYLDYLVSVGGKANQPIRLASNLVASKRSIEESNLFSIIKPLGATIDDGKQGGSDVVKPRVNIKSVNNGSLFLTNQKLIDLIGRVVDTQTWDDVKEPKNLKPKGQAALDNQSTATLRYDITAADLGLLPNSDLDTYEIGNVHQIINQVQGIDDELRIVSMNIDIINILSSKLTIGAKALTQEQLFNLFKKQSEASDGFRSQLEQHSNEINELVGKQGTTETQLSELKSEVEGADLGGMSNSIGLLLTNVSELATADVAINTNITRIDTQQTANTISIKDLITRIEKLEKGGSK